MKISLQLSVHTDAAVACYNSDPAAAVLPPVQCAAKEESMYVLLFIQSMDDTSLNRLSR
jgi:hypothetical protein